MPLSPTSLSSSSSSSSEVCPTYSTINTLPVHTAFHTLANAPRSEVGLYIHTTDYTITTRIPPQSIIALFRTENDNEYTLLHTSDRDSLAALSLVLPSYTHGQLTIANPPAQLLERFLYTAVPEWLDIKGGKAEITVILSVGAGGKGKAIELYNTTIKGVLNEIGLKEERNDYRVIRTTSESSIKDFTIETFSSSLPPSNSSSPKSPIHTILLLSGDTSLFELINALPISSSLLQRIHLALLPTGSGNALSSSTYVTAHPLTALLLGTPNPLPLFHATFSPTSFLLTQSTKLPIPPQGLYGAVVLSWCFHASLVADSDTPHYRNTYPGTQRFHVAARENLNPSPHLYKGRISVRRTPESSWEDLQQEKPEGEGLGYWYFLTTLVSRLEPTFLINPLGKPLDGVLRVVHFGQLPPHTPLIPTETQEGQGTKSVIKAMEAAYDHGRHVELPGVGYERDGVEAVRVEIQEEDYVPEGGELRGRERWRRLCIDGAIVEVEKDGWVEVKKVEKGFEGVNILWREML